MAYLGREAAKAPLVTADIPDDSITAAKIVDATIAAGDLAANSVDSSELVDGSIDTSHIADNQITLAKMAGGTDGNIISYDASGDPVAIATGDDGQVLTSAGAGQPCAFEDAAGGGITEADTWRTTAAFSGSSDITANWERDDTDAEGNIGTGMTESSGIFTFPSTGFWYVSFHCLWVLNAAESRYLFAYLYVSETSGSYATGAFGASNINSTGNAFASATADKIMSVTDTTNIKVKFGSAVFNGNAETSGGTAQNDTYATFVKLAET